VDSKSEQGIHDIHARVPVDRLAVRVTRFAGEHWDPDKSVQTKDRVTPLSTIPVSPGTQDLTGHRFGRFVVFGQYSKSSDAGRLWVVRCVCGTYTTRRTKAILNPANSRDCCAHCEHLKYLQRSDHFRRTGKNLP
jgi:hypothetical protein